MAKKWHFLAKFLWLCGFQKPFDNTFPLFFFAIMRTVSRFEVRSLPVCQLNEFYCSFAGIIYGNMDFDASLTQLRKLFSHAMREMAKGVCIAYFGQVPGPTAYTIPGSRLALSNWKGSVVITGALAMFLKDFGSHVIPKLWPPSSLNYKARHGSPAYLSD